MRISDWSSDVCSSDLRGVVVAPVEGQGADVGEQSGDLDGVDRGVEQDEVVAVRAVDRDSDRDAGTVDGHRPLPAQLPKNPWKSEERRVGEECVRKWRTRCETYT